MKIKNNNFTLKLMDATFIDSGWPNNLCEYFWKGIWAWFMLIGGGGIQLFTVGRNWIKKMHHWDSGEVPSLAKIILNSMFSLGFYAVVNKVTGMSGWWLIIISYFIGGMLLLGLTIGLVFCGWWLITKIIGWWWENNMRKQAPIKRKPRKWWFIEAIKGWKDKHCEFIEYT